MIGSWRPNITATFWPLLLWPSTLCRSRSPDAQPEALRSTLLGAGFLYCILSATSLVPKLHRGSRGPPRPGVAFPTTSHLTPTGTRPGLTSVLTELYNSLTPTRSPTRSWNRMFYRHQAEITVMQFRGHSPPVRQSMRVSWDFLVCPISAHAIPSPNCHWNVSLPSGASPWMAFWAGSKVKI